jgi:hypothetical protein
MVSGAPMNSLLPVVIGKPSGGNHSLKKKSASGPGRTALSRNVKEWCQGRNDRKPPGRRKRGPLRLSGSAAAGEGEVRPRGFLFLRQ